jgi:hypothetical protein
LASSWVKVNEFGFDHDLGGVWLSISIACWMISKSAVVARTSKTPSGH